jgi:Zn-dependent protease with chaperone function
MKRLALALTTAVMFCLVVAAPALAGYGTPPEGDSGTRNTAGGTGTDAGTAFTGTNISLGVAILAALVVFGVVALLVSRRRAAAAAE